MNEWINKNNKNNPKKSENRRPTEPPESLPWSLEKDNTWSPNRHKLNMAENMMADFIVKSKKAYTTETSMPGNAVFNAHFSE